MNANNVSRRTFLAGATAITTTAGATAAVLGTIPATHPDAALLEAWQAYVSRSLAIDALSPGRTNKEMRPYYEAADASGARVEQLSAKTADGIVVKLKYLLAHYSETWDVEQAIWRGQSCEQHLSGDYRERMLWSLIADVERMGGQA